jgi:hypothetical protein
MTKAERQEELDAVKMVAREIMNAQPECPVGFNYGFLYATAEIAGKRTRFFVGSHCPASWTDVEIAVRKGVKEIVSTDFRLD